MTLPVVDRTFEAIITLAGGQQPPPPPPPVLPSTDSTLGCPFAMLSHISYCFFIKIIVSNPIISTPYTSMLNCGLAIMGTGAGRLFGRSMFGGTFDL